ncbi:MAG: phage portal protein [Rhizobiales bacterium]|nr:phage portal protein [Hyphomicrobiales bacterium]
MWPFTKRSTEVRSSIESPSVSLTDPAAWSEIFGSWRSAAGVEVTVERALGVPAVWAATNFIPATIASLPLDLFSRTDEGRQTADKDPLYAVLHDAVNDEMSSFAWRKQAMEHVLLRGRSFTVIERNKAGRVRNLWLLDPTKVRVERKAVNGVGQTTYIHEVDGKRTSYGAADIIDIPWRLKFDGLSHYDPVSTLRDAIGLAIALEQYGAKFFENGGVPPLQLVGPLNSPGAVGRAATDVMEALKEAKKEGRPILPMPLMHELKAIGIDPQKGQMTEARRMQIEQIARIYQLPPTFLQDLTNGTFSNTEQQDLHFVKHTLSQWLKAWEQELNLKLFAARNRKNFVEFNQDGLLRGDFKSRMEGYSTAIQVGINSPDEVRRMENWPDFGGAAKKLFMQGAMSPIEKLGEAKPAPQPQPEQPASEEDNSDVSQAA